MGDREELLAVGDDDQLGLELAQLLGQLFKLRVSPPGWSDEKDGEPGADGGYRAMHEIGRGIGIGPHIGQFLQLEGQFGGGSIIVATADDRTIVHVAITLGPLRTDRIADRASGSALK